jgi:hypothetical protein
MKNDTNTRSYFKGRTAILTSMHKKEEAIQPLLKNTYDIDLFIPSTVDTDSFGTFSGEIERPASPEETVVLKCELGMSQFGYDLGIASEGSFGPYPLMPLIPCNEELIVLIDKKNNWLVIGRSISFETNFGAETISNEKQLIQFAKKSKFPSHGLILKQNQFENKESIKGITDWNSLKNAFNVFAKKKQSAWIETDMRAHLNPTRMKNIAAATQDLIKKLNSLCPICLAPGFTVCSSEPGLPCALCGLPTASTAVYRYCCKICNHSESVQFPHGKEVEDPMYCSFCNP